MPTPPDHTADAWIAEGRDFISAKNWIGALSSVRNALRLDVRNLQAWHMGCEITMKQDRQYVARRYARALKRFARAKDNAAEMAFADTITAEIDHYYATYHLRLGETDLTHFAARGDENKVRELLEAGVNPNERNSTNWTALHCVAMRGKPEMARLLVKYGADLEAEDSLNETPLIKACCYGNDTIIPVLLELGANVNHVAKEKHTALWYAISSMKDLTAVKLLIAAGADPNESYEYGDNPFLISVSAQNKEVTDYLLPMTEDPARMNQHQVCALHFAASYNDASLIEQLIARGVDVNQKTANGNTALMAAAETNSIDAARVLLAAFADVHALNEYGETATSLAERRENEAICKLLAGKN